MVGRTGVPGPRGPPPMSGDGFTSRRMENTLKIDILFTGGAVFAGSGEPLSGFAVAVEGNRIVGIALVSYTHLDVYKRQALLIIAVACAVSLLGDWLSERYEERGNA